MTKGRILVVEDDAPIANIVRFHFQKLGYEVAVASDGAEGLDLVSESAFDAVICDLAMPRLGGVDFIRIARQANPDLAVVVISANATAENLLATLGLGAYRFLAKPFVLTELSRLVEQSMKRKVDATTSVEETDGWIEITASSDVENVERLENFVSLLAASALPPKDVEALAAGLRELLTNAIEWGNNFDPSLRVRVGLQLAADRVRVRIADEGTGFNVKDLDDWKGSDAENAIRRVKKGKRAGGFGIQMVRDLMDSVKYNEKGNEVVMTKYIRK